MVGLKGFGAFVAKTMTTKKQGEGVTMRHTRSGSNGGQQVFTRSYQEGRDVEERQLRRGRKGDRESPPSDARKTPTPRREVAVRERTRTPSPTKFNIQQRTRPKSPSGKRQRGRSLGKTKEKDQKSDRRGRSASTHREKSVSRKQEKISSRSRSRASRRDRSRSRSPSKAPSATSRSRSPSKAPSATSRSKATSKTPSKKAITKSRSKSRCQTPLSRIRSATPLRRSATPHTHCSTPHKRSSSRLSKKERRSRSRGPAKKEPIPVEITEKEILESLGPLNVTLSIGKDGTEDNGSKKQDRYAPRPQQEDFEIADENSIVSDLISMEDDDAAFARFLAKRHQGLGRSLSTETSMDASIFEAAGDGWLSTYDSCLGAFCGFEKDHRYPQGSSLEYRKARMASPPSSRATDFGFKRDDPSSRPPMMDSSVHPEMSQTKIDPFLNHRSKPS